MVNSYGHVFIYRYVFEITKWKRLSYRQLLFFKYNIILQCIYAICKCEELFFKNKFSDIVSELQCCILF